MLNFGLNNYNQLIKRKLHLKFNKARLEREDDGNRIKAGVIARKLRKEKHYKELQEKEEAFNSPDRKSEESEDFPLRRSSARKITSPLFKQSTTLKVKPSNVIETTLKAEVDKIVKLDTVRDFKHSLQEILKHTD